LVARFGEIFAFSDEIEPRKSVKRQFFPCVGKEIVHIHRVLGGTAGRRGTRRGGLYFLAAGG
jgi:hypothetical protein